MIRSRWTRLLSTVLAALHLLLVAHVPHVQAAMLSNQEVLSSHYQAMDKQQLHALLDDEEVAAKLLSMGVEREQVAERINNLTPSELAQFNQQLEQAPAGAGVVGIIVLFLVIFIVTDMLCATNIFNFVNCINR
ncbi:PA2779 family protein [Stutzerimonas urumqiensis]|uniref:PA2779 family protein n=1 Tax=Stutzerimonas urumqiensis TaxID=638269 RepID=UPI003DA25C03